MADSTTRGYPYATSGDPNDLGYISQVLAEAVDADVQDIEDRTAMVSGSAALYGSYTGQPLTIAGGQVSVNTNSSSIATVSLGSTFATGLKSIVFTPVNDTYTQIRFVSATAANTMTVVIRRYDGTGAGSQSGVGLNYVALGW